MPYRAIIFDLDGTLLDTLEDLTDTANHVLATRGFPTHPVDAYRYFVGDGAAMLIRRALPEAHRDDETHRTCHEAFLREYGQSWKVKTRPYEGVPEMLDALAARKLKMAILSNKPHQFTGQCVEELLPDWTFDLVLGQRAEVPRKPDPAGAREVAETLAIPAADFLYLGDTATDMKTAVGAGMFPVGVLWGFRPAEELRASGARALIEHPTEVLALLD